jgi:ubiquinone/menaquinone biosynthesis C-methylase UbiE
MTTEFDSGIRAFYEKGDEVHRLTGGFPSGPLELERTKEIIARYIAPPPLTILDVGGGPGAYASWLAARGDHVHLVDPVQLHVNQARAAHPAITAEIGDARQLRQADASVDVVLLLGPLYHLIDRKDRRRALDDARRVLRPGGWIFAAAISRYAALLDLLLRLDKLHEPEIFRIVSNAVQTGVFNGSTGNLFTTAYFHSAQELADEVSESGFASSAVLGIEGPGCWLKDLEKSWVDPQRHTTILQVARLLESNPEMVNASSHLLAVARKPE